MEGTPIQLIDGGSQKRCFTDVKDGVEALYRIIENKDDICDGKIINIGNPTNEASIRELAEMLLDKFNQHPERAKFPPFAGFQEIESGSYYGSGYQDVQYRRPSIRNARKYLKWSPQIGMDQSVEQTLDFFIQESLNSQQSLKEHLENQLKQKGPHEIISVPRSGDKKTSRKKHVVPQKSEN